MKTLDTEVAAQLIDFAPTEETREMGFAEAQLHGAVAAYNMLARNRLAYLADEVGMGKTYVALGVMGLVRFFNPEARILVVAPRENIQLKWIKELKNFIHFNWRAEDNRVKNLHGNPVRGAVACSRIDELARMVQVDDHRDLYLRNTTFSASVSSGDARRLRQRQIRPFVPWVPRQLLSVRQSEEEFRDNYGRVLNALLPKFDLLVVDEAHNFKQGFGPRVSNRNRILGLALGHPQGATPSCPWYSPRVQRVLLLSATPFEYDYGDLYRQLDVFGFAGQRVRDSAGEDPLAIRTLLDDDEALKQELARRFLLRRVAYLKIAGKKHSKNQYRCEWRQGGFEKHDEPMALADPRQRLIVGLIQKKVTELLGDKKFGNRFQIGMLSSFESFLESVSPRQRPKRATPDPDESENGEDGPVFDGHQTEDRREQLGIDRHSLENVVRSYKRRFKKSLPHPKLDATADRLRRGFETGEKALVFVRRVATTGELKSKLDDRYDDWIRRKLIAELPPSMHEKLAEIFGDYQEDHLAGRRRKAAQWDSVDEEQDSSRTHEEDEGGTDSFFAWFFRGEGPKDVLSGAAFQRNRLRSRSSAYATMFEDDRVAWLLGDPEDTLQSLTDVLGCDRGELARSLRQDAWQHFRRRSQQVVGYPKLIVFECYQVAALRRMENVPGELGRRAEIVLQERYEDVGAAASEPPAGFPVVEEFLGLETFFTELRRRGALRERLWPEEAHLGFREAFRRREQRRELISAQVRLGQAYIDLYILAIKMLGSFDLGQEAAVANPAQQLVQRFLDRLTEQSHQPGMHAYYELAAAAKAFDVLVSVNFPEIRSAKLLEVATIVARTLQHQVPVGHMHGGVNKRMVRQFRMPGYPLVLVTTDVLQEGEDLHTFCKQVIHYGITWTPSATEQRTGRIDRIGSLVQRQLDGRATEAERDELIQVFYPHLEDTVERLQVQTVMERLNKFVRMVHQAVPHRFDKDSTMDTNVGMLRKKRAIPPVAGLLESAYPVTDAWCRGELSAEDINLPDIGLLETRFRELCEHVVESLHARATQSESRHSFAGKVAIADHRIIPWEEDARDQDFMLELRSQVVGDETLIRCTSTIGSADLRDSKTLDAFYDWQCKLGVARLCARLGDHHQSTMSIELDRLFHMEATQAEEIEDLVRTVVLQADRMEQEILESTAY